MTIRPGFDRHARNEDDRPIPRDNKGLVRALVEGWQHEHRIEIADEILADGFVDHSARPGELATKAEAIQWFQYVWEALPDFAVQINHQIAEGDLVAAHKTFSGTHEGEFLGYPPSGRRVTYEVFDLLRVVDGKVVEHWMVSDMAGLFQQLRGTDDPARE